MKDIKKLICCAGSGILLTSMVCIMGCNCDKKEKLKKEFCDVVDDAIDNAIDTISQAAERIVGK